MVLDSKKAVLNFLAKRPQKNRQKLPCRLVQGFTLLETLFVISILGILAAFIWHLNSAFIREQRVIASVDYSSLDIALTSENLEKANNETYEILMKSVTGMRDDGSRASHENLTARDIKKIPCQSIRTMNAIWNNYTAGQHSFSTQARIFEKTGKNYSIFVREVGWEASKLYPSEFDFILYSGSEGTYPILYLREFSNRHGGFNILYDKYKSCGL